MSDLNDVVIVDGIRTPFAKSGTALKSVHPAELGTVALKELLARTEIDVNLIDEVIIGNTGTPSDAANIGRVVALNAGVPKKTSAYTVHRNCASALESISTGFDKIRAGSGDLMCVGGTESMSQMPLIYDKKSTKAFAQFGRARGGFNKFKAMLPMLNPFMFMKPRIALLEGLTDPFAGINMGQTAEILAKEFDIDRKTQDEYALLSHQKAVKAQEAGILAEEIVPITLGPDHKKMIKDDVGPRATQSMEALGKLKPYFDRKFGSVTPGNACPITDGAAMLLIMTRQKAKDLGLKPLAKIRSYAFAGLDPERMGLGPVYATPIALKRAGLTLKDIDLIELNEAFAAQVIACQKAAASKKYSEENFGISGALGEIRDDILNVNGGAIAIGHPVGATGTRLVLTLMKEMRRKGVGLGLATLCIGGGQGGAMIIENEG